MHPLKCFLLTLYKSLVQDSLLGSLMLKGFSIALGFDKCLTEGNILLCAWISVFQITKVMLFCWKSGIQRKLSKVELWFQLHPWLTILYVPILYNLINGGSKHMIYCLLNLSVIQIMQNDRIRWWPIYHDDQECVGKVQLSIGSTIRCDETAHIKVWIFLMNSIVSTTIWLI